MTALILIAAALLGALGWSGRRSRRSPVRANVIETART
jgi:hypothetical protein